jgi:hypothetical protein
VGIFSDVKHEMRAAKRLGAFKRAKGQGMTVEAARNYSDQIYPPTPGDLAYEKRLREGRVFPWFSALLLSYPIAAMIYIYFMTPAHGASVIGYGLVQLGYLLFAAGIIAGTFKVLGLRKRWQVLVAGVGCFLLGTLLTNLTTV